MNFALCATALVAAVACSAQQSDLVGSTPHYRIAEAKTISIQELQQRSQSKAAGVFHEGKLAAKRGDHARAIKLFEKAVAIDPGFTDARNDLAVELIVSGEPQRAVEQLQQVIELQPHFLMAYTNLGAILCSEKKFGDAEGVLRRALSVDPNSGKANLLLAVSLYGQNKRGTETQSALEIAAKSSPLAIRLLKEWFGLPQSTEAGTLTDVAKETIPSR